MIVILDYDAGNLKSVQKALKFVNYEAIITRDISIVEKATKLILPGVGNFGKVMDRIRSLQLETIINEKIQEGIQILGICVGLQILFESSEESPKSPGLGICKGDVKMFTAPKVPQIGWNKVEPKESSIIQPGYAYFVNSFYVDPVEQGIIAASSNYYQPFTCAIIQDNITAFQFHPEKSGRYGLQLLKRWAQC